MCAYSNAKENTNARLVCGMKLSASRSGHCTTAAACCCPAHRFSDPQEDLAALPHDSVEVGRMEILFRSTANSAL